jgi:hypothetical protein
MKKLSALPCFLVENVDGMKFWTLIDPRTIGVSEDETVIETRTLGDVFNEADQTPHGTASGVDIQPMHLLSELLDAGLA